MKWSAIAACWLAMGGCGLRGLEGPMAEGPWAFAPASMRIYPLTHAERAEDGRTRIILHVELKDRWGDSAKGLGVLQVRLFRPLPGPTPGLEEESAAWTIDLSDADENQLRFEPATRTYRFALRDLPAWVDAPGEGPRRMRLRATFRTITHLGREETLRDEYVIEF